MATYLASAIGNSKVGKAMDEFSDLVPHAKKLVSELSVTNTVARDYLVKTDVDTTHILREIKELLSDIRTPVKSLKHTAEYGSAKVDEIVRQVEALLTTDTTKTRVIKNITSHIVGIGATVHNLLHADNVQSVLNSGLAILSMLGMESEIALRIVSRFSRSGDERTRGLDPFAEEEVDVEDQVDFTKIAELLANLAGLAGKDSFLPSILVSFIKNAGSTVRNVEGCKKMWKLVEEILAEFGFDVTEKMKQMRILKETFDKVRVSAEDIETRFNVSPSDFLSDGHARKFKAHCAAVENLEKIILSKASSDLPRSLVLAVTALATQVRQQKQKLAMLSASCALRPCPVGVAIVGPSSIGKSMLTETLITEVKKEMKRVYDNKYYGTEFAEDADSWTVWFQNTADQFDQGYSAQEIHCVDDAFQDTKDADHLNYIQKISTTPALTYQASLAEKGMPYRSRLVIVSCNKFPETSATIKSIDALVNRFPVYVRADLRRLPDGTVVHPPPRDGAQFDPNFPWLRLTMGGREVSIGQVVHEMCTRLVSNDRLYVQAMEKHQGAAPSYAHRFPIPQFDVPHQNPQNAREDYETAPEAESDDEQPEWDEEDEDNWDPAEDQNWVDVEDQTDDASECPRTHGFPLQCASDNPLPMGEYFAQLHQKHKMVAANETRIEISKMQDHPSFSEAIRCMSWVQPDGTRVLLKDVFAADACFEHQVLRNMLEDPIYFYSHVNNLCVTHAKLAPRVLFLFVGVVVVQVDAVRIKVRGVWHPDVGLTTDVRLDPTLYEKLRANCNFSSWMAWTKLWHSQAGWFQKLCLIVVSPLARFALAIARLMGFDDWVDAITVSCEMLAPTITVTVLPIVFGLFVACLSRVYAHGYLFAKGFDWKQVRLILDDFTNDDFAQYLANDGQITLLRKPPATSGRLYVKHNGLCCLAGLPMWKWDGEKFVHVSSVKDLFDQVETVSVDVHQIVQESEKVSSTVVKKFRSTHPKATKSDQTVLVAFVEEGQEGSADDNKRQEIKRVAQLNKPGKLNIVPEASKSDSSVQQIVSEANEGSADQRDREDAKRVAKLNTPGKLKVVSEANEGSADQGNREELKRVAKLNAPSKVKIVQEHDGPRFSRTTKLQDKEHAKQAKEIVQEYLKEHDRLDKKLPVVPQQIDVRQKTKKSQWNVGEVPEVATEACIDENAKNVAMKIARNTFPIRNVDSGVGCFCIISGKLALFPCHLAKKGDTVEIKSKDGKTVLTRTEVRESVSQWDLACCDVTFAVSRVDKLFVDDDRFFSACGRAFIQYFPKSSVFGIVSGKYRETIPVRNNGISQVWPQRLEVTGLDTGHVMSAKGDCGGVLVVLNPAAQKKAVAMHTAGAANGATSYATILTGERWAYFRKPLVMDIPSLSVEADVECIDVELQMDHVIDQVSWAKPSSLNFNTAFFLPDEECEAQHFAGGSLKYVADAVFVSPPCSEKTALKLAPFGQPFPDVKKHPSVLTELDSRLIDPTVLQKDRFGFPSILVSQIAKYNGPSVDVDCDLLKVMVDQMVIHHSTILSECDLGVAENFDSNMWLALNGVPDDIHAKPLAFKASAGIPWAEFGASKKINLLVDATTDYSGRQLEGKWFDLTNPVSVLLYDVTKEKILLANQGQRTHSIWKDCLKDELRSDEKISQGKTRAFTAAPFESVLMMRFLFAKYKLAFTSHMFDLNHALGINPHSSSWSKLLALMREKGVKCLDGDFSSFDGSIPRQFMLAAGDIIIRTIEDVSNDGFELARRVMWAEIVDTLQCSWSTVYMKDHGNNSGQPLTTPTNSIVVFLIMWYAFCKLTGNSSLSYFLDCVNLITFGDDNIQNVCDEVTDVYNPTSICEQISQIGMSFTSAAKDGSMRWQTCTELQFLKRKFVPLTESYVIAPLDQESIVQCFNYTLLGAGDLEGWKSTTLEQLLEASLHGQRFYNQVQATLLPRIRSLRDVGLRNTLVPILLIPYLDAKAMMQVRGGGVQSM